MIILLFYVTMFVLNALAFMTHLGINCGNLLTWFLIKSNQIIWFIRYSSTDAGLQQYRGNAFTTNNITSGVS